MTCARRRRLEREAHERGRDACLESADHFGLTMSCADEYECSAPESCMFYLEALAAAELFDSLLP